MAVKKKGFLAVTKEWGRHLRPFRRRQFWKSHRVAERADRDRQLSDSDAGASVVAAAVSGSDCSGDSGGGDCG